jgi:hypothetical protein
VPHVRRVDPARYVSRLLLWQGSAWLVLAGVGLGIWIAMLPGTLTHASNGSEMLWRGAQLLVIAIGAGLGAAEVGMACRLRGSPRLLLAMAPVLQGATLAAGLVVVAIAVMIAVSVLELLAMNGALLIAVRPVPLAGARLASSGRRRRPPLAVARRQPVARRAS